MNRVIHFEIAAKDPDAIAGFFKNVFGWTINKWEGPVEYWLVGTGTEGPGIDGGIMRKTPEMPGVVNTIGVGDLDAFMDKVSEAGGTVVTEKMPIPGIGWFCYFVDPEGNMHGMMESDESAK